jgi:hypothetical protein
MRACSYRVILGIFDDVENQNDQKVRLGWMWMGIYYWRWLVGLELSSLGFYLSVYYLDSVVIRYHYRYHVHDHVDWMVCFP